MNSTSIFTTIISTSPGPESQYRKWKNRLDTTVYSIMSLSSHLLALCLICTTQFLSCKKSNIHGESVSQSCGTPVVLDSQRYQDPFRIFGPHIISLDSVYIQGDCLHFIVQSSGCDGSTWKVNTWDSERIISGQRYLSIWLENSEICQTVVRKHYWWGISHLQVSGTNTVKLLFPQFTPAISVEYQY